MERQTESKINENGSFSQKTVTTITPKDGFIPQNQINPANPNNYGNYRMGWSKSVSYSTDNPKVTIPFIIIMTGFFQILTIVLVIIGIKNGALENPSLVVGGAVFVIFMIMFTIAEIKEIKKIKNKFNNK